jgi:hypothetical protein
MRFRYRFVDPKAPGMQRLARHYEFKLRKILSAAARRDSRRDPVLANLYRTAKVVGINPRFPTKSASIEFNAPPLRETLFEIYSWSNLDDFPWSVHAESLAWALREQVKEARRER